MEIRYANNKVKAQCTSLKAAENLFGGNKNLALSLHARINAIEQAPVIKEIILMPQFHFHKLKGRMKNYFAVDVKSRRDKWRIIFYPIKENGEEYYPCNIDEIASVVTIVEILEVSAHYE